MALPENFLETIITAVVSSGGTAVSAIAAFFKDVKRRLDELDRRVGSVDSRNGLAYTVDQLEETVKKIEGWSNHPPEWLMQLVNRGRRAIPVYGNSDEYEAHDTKLRSLERRVKDLEGQLREIERTLERTVLDDAFDVADRQRAMEISEIRANIAGISGVLKGLESAISLLGKGPVR